MIVEGKDRKKLKKHVTILFNFLCAIFLPVFTIVGILSKNIVIFVIFFGFALMYTIMWIVIYKFYVSKI